MKWIPLDNYHKKPKEYELVILSDGEGIYYDMCWVEEFTSRSDGKFYRSGWYHINGVAPMEIQPTHYIKLELP